MRYPYLDDKEFLKRFDNETHKIQYTRISVLDFETENIKASIEGKSTGGSCNVSGTSNMRRTASCTLLVDPEGVKLPGYNNQYQQYYNITEVQNLISMNKKVRIETGFDNSLAAMGDYEEHDIIWFPLGTYVIKTASVSKNNSGINISLTLNDKCALLNGDMGGIIPADTIFSEMEILYNNQKNRQTEDILIKDIIKFLVSTYGNEPLENIIITDIPDKITRSIKWSGNKWLRFSNAKFTEFTPEEDAEPEEGVDFIPGTLIGFILEPFVYPGTLECKAGETVATVLDKIKNALGNFEWFYDIDGRFIFQKIKNNLNDNNVESLLDLKEQDYLSYYNQKGIAYAFDNKAIITSISNSPQYQNIKNDFLVWGTRKGTSGNEVPIKYRLTFASKPTLRTEPLKCLCYTNYLGVPQYVPIKEGENGDIVTLGEGDSASDTAKYYYEETKNKYLAWSQEKKMFETLTGAKVVSISPNCWRTELYLQALENKRNYKQGYYDAEILFEFPKFIELDSNDRLKINMDKVQDYWIDFLEGSEGGSESISQFSISNIGRRTKVTTDGNINSLFTDDSGGLTRLLVEADGDTLEAVREGKKFGATQIVQVEPELFKYFSTGGQNSAYEKIKDLIFTHTQYNESVTLSVIPIYYLEPNTLISVFDRETGVYGEYLVKTISLPLTPNGTSNISATRALSKTI